MATKTFAISKDALVANLNGTLSVGAGQDDHLCVGKVGSTPERSLLQFSLSWTDVGTITKAELKIYQSGSHAHGTKTTDSIYVQRVTSTWTEGTRGSDELWYSDNSVEWSNQPTVTTSGQATHTPSTSHNVLRTIDITNIVKAWAPTSIPGGGGATNYGIRLIQTSEVTDNYTEFWSREAGSTYDPYILLTYEPPITNTTEAPTIIKPTANTLARITNMADVVDWRVSGGAKPRLQFQYNDAEESMSKYRVRIYNAASGTEGDASMVYDSGDVVLSVVDGTTVTHDANYVCANGTTYYWTVKTWDSFATPATAGESARTAFKVRWGQAVYQQDCGAGTPTPTSHSLTINPASPATNTQRTILYRGFDGTSTYSSWSSSIAVLNGWRYAQILVRLSTDVSGTNPTVSDMTLSYVAGGTTAAWLDFWAISNGMGAYFAVTESDRRLGFRCIQGTNVNASCAVVANKNAAPIKVTPGTTYTLSCYVKTPNGALPGTSKLYLAVWDDGGTWGTVASGANVAGAYTVDTSAAPDGWERLSFTFTVPSDLAAIRCGVQFIYNTTPSTFLVDGMALDVGDVALPWTMAAMTNGGVVGGAGVVLDASLGAVFRLRGSTGGTRDTVELGSSGLVFGGDANLYSGVANILRTDDTFSTGNELRFGSNQHRIADSTADRASFLTSVGGALIGMFKGIKVSSSYADPDPATAGIQFGADTNLYRSAANTLKTDDALEVGGVLTSTPTIQSGAVTVSLSSAGSGDASVTFGTAFAGAPRVQATVTTTTGLYFCNVNNITASGFTARVIHRDGTAATVNITVNWVAIYGSG